MSWKKGFNILLKVFLLCLVILVMLIAVRQVTVALVTNSLHIVAETDHFILSPPLKTKPYIRPVF